MTSDSTTITTVEHDALAWLGEGRAIERLREDLQAGLPWYPAVLEAIARWDRPAETFKGRRFIYLVEGEAFDWLVLVERFYEELGDLFPADEIEQLLFDGIVPGGFDEEMFRDIVGPAKFRSFLNFHYGIVVEQALNRSVEEQVYKEQGIFLQMGARNADETAAERIYGLTRREMLARWRLERGLPKSDRISANDLKAFTYWCFKFRLRQNIRVKVAADTKRGLDTLERLRSEVLPVESEPETASIDLSPWRFRVVGVEGTEE